MSQARYRYRCPGADTAGRGLTASVLHVGDCCERFARLAPWRQARTGLLDTAPVTVRRDREELPKPPAPVEISLAEATAVLAALQARAAQFPDEEPPGATVHLYYVDGENTLDDVMALMDLGRPYNLVVGYRRYRTAPDKEQA